MKNFRDFLLEKDHLESNLNEDDFSEKIKKWLKSEFESHKKYIKNNIDKLTIEKYTAKDNPMRFHDDVGYLVALYWTYKEVDKNNIDDFNDFLKITKKLENDTNREHSVSKTFAELTKTIKTELF